MSKQLLVLLVRWTSEQLTHLESFRGKTLSPLKWGI